MIHEDTIFISTSDLVIAPGELYRAMGYGEAIPDEDIRNLLSTLLTQALSIAKPSFYYKVFDNPIIDDDKMSIGDMTFTSGKTINGLLRRSTRVALFVATAGEEFQQWMDSRLTDSEMLDIFIIDAIGTTLVEAVGDYIEVLIEKEIASEAIPMKHTNRFSPGYCGWRIEEQHLFFSMLPTNICGISLSDSSLMHPIKSISGVVGIGENVTTKKYGCAICKRIDCYMRK